MTFPLGPYHPALPEPISLRLALRGETVTGVETHTGYLHRGVTSLAAQRDLPAVLDLVERMCGTCGHSHRLALCMALEAAAGVTPPPRAQALRTMFAEVERAQSRLWLLMRLGRLTDFGTLFTAAVEARELLFEGAIAATERRLFWGVAVPGGVVNVVDPDAFTETVAAINERIAPLERLFTENGAFTRRTHGSGKIVYDTAIELGLTGLLLRATGEEAASADVRLTAPYEAYELFTEELISNGVEPRLLHGDVPSRARLAFADLQASLRLILALLQDLPEGQERETFATMLTPGAATATVEGPHGSETVSLHLISNVNGGLSVDTTQPGWLSDLVIATPSAKNVSVVPIILNRQSLNEVPFVLDSLDLCMACVDQ